MRARTHTHADTLQVYGLYTSAAMNKSEAVADAANRFGQRLPANAYAATLLCLSDAHKKVRGCTHVHAHMVCS